jgi:hypothetical protein
MSTILIIVLVLLLVGYCPLGRIAPTGDIFPAGRWASFSWFWSSWP